jgi:hypothetical protein
MALLPLPLMVLADTFCVIQIVGGAIILDNCSKAKPNGPFSSVHSPQSQSLSPE